LAHPHLKLFGIVMNDWGFFISLVFRIQFQQIVVCWLGGWIVQERVGTGFYEGVAARRADSNGSAPSWLLD
jgi:hypothetical protein